MNIKEAVSLTLPPMELKGKGTSTYTEQTIRDRLKVLDGDDSEAAKEEWHYLANLLEKMDP